MAANIRKSAATACRVQPPGPRNARISHEIFRMDAAKVSDFSNFTAVYDVFRQPDHRVLEIVEANSCLDILLLRCQRHFQTIGGAGGKRLFAINMFARIDRRQRHFLVKTVGGGDVDEIDCRIGYQVAPVAGRMGKAQLFRGFLRRCFINIGQRVQLDPHGQIEDAIDVGQRQRMGLAHKARPDQTCNDCHAFLPSADTIHAGKAQPALQNAQPENMPFGASLCD